MRITYFVVQPFERTEKGRLRVMDAVEAQSSEAAIRTARARASRGGAVAFAKSGDPDTGDFDDAVILGQFGDVPDLADVADVRASA